MIFMARAMAAKLQNCSGDIFATWAVGGTVAMAPRMLFFASLGWAIQHLEVTHLTCTPSLWQSLELLNRKYPKGWMAFDCKRWRAHAQDLRPAANRQHGLACKGLQAYRILRVRAQRWPVSSRADYAGCSGD